MSADGQADFISQRLAVVIEAAGVAVIAIGAIVTTVGYLLALPRHSPTEAYAAYRLGLARSILLRLE